MTVTDLCARAADGPGSGQGTHGGRRDVTHSLGYRRHHDVRSRPRDGNGVGAVSLSAETTPGGREEHNMGYMGHGYIQTCTVLL